MTELSYRTKLLVQRYESMKLKQSMVQMLNEQRHYSAQEKNSDVSPNTVPISKRRKASQGQVEEIDVEDGEDEASTPAPPSKNKGGRPRGQQKGVSASGAPKEKIETSPPTPKVVSLAPALAAPADTGGGATSIQHPPPIVRSMSAFAVPGAQQPLQQMPPGYPGVAFGGVAAGLGSGLQQQQQSQQQHQQQHQHQHQQPNQQQHHQQQQQQHMSGAFFAHHMGQQGIGIGGGGYYLAGAPAASNRSSPDMHSNVQLFQHADPQQHAFSGAAPPWFQQHGMHAAAAPVAFF